MTQFRNGLGLVLLVALALRVVAALLQPLLLPLAVLFVVVVLLELLLSRRHRW